MSLMPSYFFYCFYVTCIFLFFGPMTRIFFQVMARVRELVAGIWKEAKVEMYGSCYTGARAVVDQTLQEILLQSLFCR